MKLILNRYFFYKRKWNQLKWLRRSKTNIDLEIGSTNCLITIVRLEWNLFSLLMNSHLSQLIQLNLAVFVVLGNCLNYESDQFSIVQGSFFYVLSRKRSPLCLWELLNLFFIKFYTSGPNNTSPVSNNRTENTVLINRIYDLIKTITHCIKICNRYISFYILGESKNPNILIYTIFTSNIDAGTSTVSITNHYFIQKTMTYPE